MKKYWKILLLCILIPLAVGVVAGAFTTEGMVQFQMIKKPLLAPPAWLFPIVWTILYIIMGSSSYLIYISEATEEEKRKAFTIYGYQLLVNFLWPVFFFNFQWYGFSYLWLMFLWILVAIMIWQFSKSSKTAALLNIPYLLWLSYAGYLNLTIWMLNR
ncbi:MAG: tryptophan-rich sensory protein [Lachnospiraceae bacterium]|nr:tryptophan-rich sensory protein [Lachnospiraceae bacterium]